tara:strand:+ start:174 stop:1265 length:1092 start_codon:yes stop_codon:yes gene_type:complete
MIKSIKTAIVATKSFNFNLGVISFLKNYYGRKNLDVLLINTQNISLKNVLKLEKLYKKYLDINSINFINIPINNNKIENINEKIYRQISDINFDILVAREQQYTMPKSDKIICMLFKYNNIILLEDNIFGYYLDKNNSLILNYIYFIKSIFINTLFIIKNFNYIRNNKNFLSIYKPQIYTFRKNSKYRPTVFNEYQKIINEESISASSLDDEHLEAIVLTDIYYFKSLNYYSSTPTIKEINKGIDIYLKVIDQVSKKFNIEKKSIKIKLHPITDINLYKMIIDSDLRYYLFDDKINKLSLELFINNLKKVKYCFAFGSSSLIYVEDLFKIESYLIKSYLKIKEPNYIYYNKLIKLKKIKYINF